jgi:pimeloyl-ACP methyl ester carboxylesterase/DNA-binding SARP family transcriptional activator
VIDRLWPELSVEDGAPRLHKAAHYARRTIGMSDAVVLRDELVSLFPEREIVVDASDWEESAERALASGDPLEASTVVEGLPAEPLQQDLYEPWAARLRERLTLLRDRLLRQAGRWEDLLALDPTDEDAYLSLMGQHVAEGDPAAALAQFERMEAALRRELDIEPGAVARRMRDEALAAVRDQEPVVPQEEVRGHQRIHFCLTSDDVRIAYAITGDGPPLVKAANWLTHLDHDWHSPVWRHWLTDLSRGRQLIRYDERGCGLSDWDLPEDQASFETWVHDLEAVIDATGHEIVDLLGISQGGAVAVAYAARHPERVRRIVLYGSFARGRVVAAETDEQHEIFQTHLQLARVGWGHDTPVFRQVFTAQFMPSASRELWDAFNELQRLTTTPTNAAMLMEVSGNIDVTGTAPKVRAPTLVLHSRGDQRPPFAEGRLLASLIPNSRFVALESDNHILLADEPAWQVFLTEVNAFLDAP